ncbi:4Fe-4S single cluster domain-containing protein [Aestuariivirga sp.]|uniref:4Fe-4S single cluster domain-containing protein n=1 Tax=Aestuariivirga sp. TaxID=2650926 RepID=UPI003BAC6D7B
MEANVLHLSRVHFPVTTLGPGNRIGIWFQGCSIRCVGCISLDTWDLNRGKTTVEEVLRIVSPWASNADGVTISGGEPFDQPDALLNLLAQIRLIHSGDVLVYSGHPLESLPLSRFDGLIDAIISDPFLLSAPQTIGLRGSDNQRLFRLTELGNKRFSEAAVSEAQVAQRIDILFDDESGEVFLAGIPRRDDLTRLKDLLEVAGHRALTTEDTKRRL